MKHSIGVIKVDVVPDETTVFGRWFLVRRLCHAGRHTGQAFVDSVSMATPGDMEMVLAPRSPLLSALPHLGITFSDLYFISCLMK